MPIAIKVLILPKFESGGMTGDFPGEAQYYYDAYLSGAEEYDVLGNKLYVKNGIALCVTGMGKVNAALSTYSILTDSRFDFSEALILSVGCAGTAKDYGVMGDVFLISATVDLDLGHRIDSKDLTNPNRDITWYHDEAYDDMAFRFLSPTLTKNAYNLVKDIKVSTTEKTKKYMARAFDNAPWAIREPKVLLGTTVTSDNYWKGETDHKNALACVEKYGCPHPFATSEMEDNAIAVTLDKLGLLDHFVIVRSAVNTDVFMNGATPESLWASEHYDSLDTDDGLESADIFKTAMENHYKVGSVIIDAFLNGKLKLEK